MSKMREWNPNGTRKTMGKEFAKRMDFKSGVKGRRSDRWWVWTMDCDEVIMCKMRWTRGRVGRIEVDGIKRELISQVRWCSSWWFVMTKMHTVSKPG